MSNVEGLSNFLEGLSNFLERLSNLEGLSNLGPARARAEKIEHIVFFLNFPFFSEFIAEKTKSSLALESQRNSEQNQRPRAIWRAV